MAGLRSTPARPGWVALLLSGLAVWLLPVPVGVLLLTLAMGLGAGLGLDGTGGDLHPLLALHIAGWVFLFSPMLSWIGLIAAIPAAAWLVWRGWAGWVSFALLGLGSGTLAGSLVPGFATVIAALWGLMAAIVFRWLALRLGTIPA